MTSAYDALIIGAGQAGPPLAGRLTAAGMSVGLIERKLFATPSRSWQISEPRIRVSEDAQFYDNVCIQKTQKYADFDAKRPSYGNGPQ
jgi:2-polyprenyl-6-methoxyphenol hydroxylase-like FAD-dependent oxidoreductase